MSSYLKRGILRMQIASNLHVHNNTYKINKTLLQPTGEMLALCGNIGQPYCVKTRDFFKWADDHYSQIFWIPGGLEYSSQTNNLATWNERADQYYESIRNWNLMKTVFCQKMEYAVPYTNITILATPLGIPYDVTRQIYSWCHIGQYKQIGPKDYSRFFRNELEWVSTKLQKTTGPNLLLSHAPIYERAVTNLYGVANAGEAKTNSGGIPWSAVNMGGYSTFRNNMMMEWVEKRKPESL